MRLAFSKQHMCNYYAEVSVRENKALSEWRGTGILSYFERRYLGGLTQRGMGT